MCWLRDEGSSLCELVGRDVLGPVNLLGFPLHESGLLGIPGLHPCQRPPSDSVILVIAEPLDLVLMTPDRGIPSTCPRSQLSARASDGVTGVCPS